MTTYELIEHLRKVPPDTKVFIGWPDDKPETDLQLENFEFTYVDITPTCKFVRLDLIEGSKS